ncbi:MULTISPECIES: hypothetical protein [unclassified Gilliamella]|jgi:hypothetical protein|nr:hypothetical protein [Gilliamella apicola]
MKNKQMNNKAQANDKLKYIAKYEHKHGRTDESDHLRKIILGMHK